MAKAGAVGRVWVPSHTDDSTLEPEVAARRLDKARGHAQWQEAWVHLNGLADDAAKQGLVGHAVPLESVRRVRRVDCVAKQVLMHMATTVLQEAAATPPERRRVRWSGPTGRPRGRPAMPMVPGPTAKGHYVERHGEGWMCTRCQRRAFAASSIKQLRSSACPQAHLAGVAAEGGEGMGDGIAALADTS